MTMDFMDHSFDAAVLIYAHFPPNMISDYHKKIARILKPEGLVILEGFSKTISPTERKIQRLEALI